MNSSTPAKMIKRRLIRSYSGTLTGIGVAKSVMAHHPQDYKPSLGDRFHAADFDFKNADDEAFVLLFGNGQRAFDGNLVGIITYGLSLGAVHDDRVLNLRRLPETAGKQA